MSTKDNNQKVGQGEKGRKLKILLGKLHGENQWRYPALIKTLSEHCEIDNSSKEPINLHSLSKNDVLLLISPKKSWRDTEVDVIHEYVERHGGNLAILASDGRKPENINRLLKAYAIEIVGDVVAERKMSREDCGDSPLFDNVENIVLPWVSGCTKIRASSDSDILFKYKEDILGVKRAYGKGAVYVFSCLGAFEDKPLRESDNRVFLNNIIKLFLTPEMELTSRIIDSSGVPVEPETVVSIKQRRKAPLKGEIRKLWTRDLKEMGFKNLAAVDTAIALDAKRVVFGYSDKLHIYDFMGNEEHVVKQGCADLAVTSHCSMMLVSVKKKIRILNRFGLRISEVETPEEYMTIRMTLDGKTFVVRGKEIIQLYDWKGNYLGGINSARGVKILEGVRREFTNHLLSPDGGYLVYKSSGGMTQMPYFVVYGIPDREILLKAPIEERSKLCFDNMISMDQDFSAFEWGPASVSTNKLLLRSLNKNRICILDIKGHEIQTSLWDYELEDNSLFNMGHALTSDGQYILYTTYDKREKKTQFNIFDVENSRKMSGLMEFPTKDVKWIPAHDGSHVVMIVDGIVTMVAMS